MRLTCGNANSTIYPQLICVPKCVPLRLASSRVHRLLPKCTANPSGGFHGQFGCDVAVGAERQADLAVSEDLHHDPGRYVHGEHDCRGGVPGIVAARPSPRLQ
jgi:hypothetical protein